MTENVLPPIKIAFIIDGRVVDILHTEDRLAAILLSNPTIVEVTGENGQQVAFVGDLYNQEDNSFTSAAIADGDLEE